MGSGFRIGIRGVLFCKWWFGVKGFGFEKEKNKGKKKKLCNCIHVCFSGFRNSSREGFVLFMVAASKRDLV